VLDYRKAPEHPYPAAIDDAFAAYGALLAEGVAPSSILLGGDSAGGGLALALLQRLRDAGLPQPRAAILLSPWVDLTARGGTIDANERYDYLSGEMLVWGAATYLAGADANGPLASPIYADLRGLPPLLVQTGGGEIFLDQNLAFVARARAAGVPVSHEVSDGMVHVFQAFAGFPAASQALASIAAFVKSVQADAPAPSTLS
jgi:acetyl esterase/lipase